MREVVWQGNFIGLIDSDPQAIVVQTFTARKELYIFGVSPDFGFVP